MPTALDAILMILSVTKTADAVLQMGTGIYDATGPITDTLMMGYANPAQRNAGLHFRLRSRALVAFDGKKRVAFVTLDAGMSSAVMKNRVIARLATDLPGMYTHDNVAISGTHTHSGPSGFLQDTLFMFSGSGWVPKTVDAFSNAVAESIIAAHKNLGPATGKLSVGEVTEANINRSPTSYLANPASERVLYKSDTDLNMTQLTVTAVDGAPIGVFNWFAVHGTAMNNTNLLVSGDNKGYASYLMERFINGPTASVRPGRGRFVAGFCATNLGDVSPNTAGAMCHEKASPHEVTGPCDLEHSTCDGKNELCWASGPGADMFESTSIIAHKQFDVATALFKAPGTPLADTGVDYAHAYVAMPGLQVKNPDTGEVDGVLCKAAMGQSFAAGTTDGPGAFDFTQGANSSNPFWPFISNILHKATREERECQGAKDILLATGSIGKPWPWADGTVAIQVLRIGSLVILSVPTELTTMAGRRMRAALKATLVRLNVIGEDGVVVIAGLCNGYADYTVTREEYEKQRYEAASTIFGPHQLNAYIQELTRVATSMAAGEAPDSAPPPQDFSAHLWKTGDKNVTDELPTGAKAFGDTIVQPEATTVGGVARCTFAATNPSNNLRPQGTFFEIVKCTPGANESCDTAVAVDGDWETRMSVQKSTVGLFGHSHIAAIEWHIPADAEAGDYRVKFYGTAYGQKASNHGFTDYTGISDTFSVSSS